MFTIISLTISKEIDRLELNNNTRKKAIIEQLFPERTIGSGYTVDEEKGYTKFKKRRNRGRNLQRICQILELEPLQAFRN